MAVLLIEHDVSMVLEVSDRVLVLDHGRPIFDGAPESLRDDDAVRSAYLGPSLVETTGVSLQRRHRTLLIPAGSAEAVRGPAWTSGFLLVECLERL